MKIHHTYDTADRTFMGMKCVADIRMTETIEDWSRVRSPSRALRRMKYGHKQNVVLHETPRKDIMIMAGVAYMHPVTMKRLEETLERTR